MSRVRFFTFLLASSEINGVAACGSGEDGILCSGYRDCCSIEALVWISIGRGGDLKDFGGAAELADSGEDEGEPGTSANRGESKVEIVVVGEDSVEFDVIELVLLRRCTISDDGSEGA